jgi:parallel beta-helix repeat protein
MRLTGLCSILFFLLFFSGIAKAQTEIRLSPADQNGINQAIEAVYSSSGGTVYLTSGVYEVTGPIFIKSNIKLTGDPDAIIRVSASSSQWFKGQIGVICAPDESLQNVEISGFCIDGNIGNLPRSYDSTPGHDRDCEKLILFGGFSSAMGNNIKIHDMKLYNSFSDGIYIRFTDGVYLYNNLISDCQHEGFYLACDRGGSIYNNQIAGICSDNGRLDNCQNFLIRDNIFFSYSGPSYGAYEHGENSLQIGNQGGSSHGYTPTAKPFTTENIEVTNNTFVSPGLQAFSLSGGENVYIHDNKFVDASSIETDGFSFDVSPSLETSERIFSNIFDILKMDYNFVYPDSSQDLKGEVQVISYPNYSLVKVQGEDLTAFKVSYAGQEVTHYLKQEIWIGNFRHQGNRVYLPGSFRKEDLKVIVISSTGFQEVTNFEIIERPEETGSINLDIVPFSVLLLVAGLFISRNLRRLIK